MSRLDERDQAYLTGSILQAVSTAPGGLLPGRDRIDAVNLLPRGRQAPRPPLVIARVVSAVLLGLLATLGFASPAHADEPLDISGPVTDHAGALGNRTADVEKALQDYLDATGYQLFVVYVPSFDGMDPTAWADQTAERSHIRDQDILLAVATQERAYGISVTDDSPLSESSLDEVENDDLLPRLGNTDWAGATIAMAEGLTREAQDNNLPWGWIVGGGAAAVGVGAFAVHRARRRYASTHVTRDEHGTPLDPLSALTTDELDKKRGAALVALDDAVKSSRQELAFAEAQFGKEATKEFAAALVQAQQLAQQAFAVQQRLDDSEPETDEEHRRLSIEVVHTCEKADAIIDEQVEAFDALRDLQAKVPEVLADMATRADEVAARLPSARAALDVLRTTHSVTDLASVAGNADQAEQLVAQAKDQCAQGQQAVAADDRATAVIRAKAAEAAVGQATTLLDAIERADADLQAAPAKIADGIASLSQDVADAGRLAAEDTLVTSAVATAQQAITYAQTPEHDPLAALSSLQQAEAELDELLAPARAAAEEAEKARVALQNSLDRATSRVRAVTDYLETRRGAVGPEARTRLSEATRLLDQATQHAPADPKAALDALTRANDYLDEAERLARTDVDRWESSQRRDSGDSMILGGIFGGGWSGGGGSGGWSGGWGGGGGSRSRSSSSRRSSSRRSSSRRSSSRSSRRSSGGGRRGSRSRGGRF